jgi:hypothetical protein
VGTEVKVKQEGKLERKQEGKQEVKQEGSGQGKEKGTWMEVERKPERDGGEAVREVGRRLGGKNAGM